LATPPPSSCWRALLPSSITPSTGSLSASPRRQNDIGLTRLVRGRSMTYVLLLGEVRSSRIDREREIQRKSDVGPPAPNAGAAIPTAFQTGRPRGSASWLSLALRSRSRPRWRTDRRGLRRVVSTIAGIHLACARYARIRLLDPYPKADRSRTPMQPSITVSSARRSSLVSRASPDLLGG
jgi:hypothetical protein